MHNVSPSQITTADRCLRRWWWQSVKGFKSPPTDATIFGGNVHSQIEYAITHYGKWDPAADVAAVRVGREAYQALTKELGPVYAGPGHLVEHDWSLPNSSEQPLPARGRIDLVMESANAIIDWKTTASLRYVKSSDELDADPQVIMYTDAMVRAGKIKLPANFYHVYTTTKGKPAALVVRTAVTADKLAIGRFKLATTMRRMQSILDKTDPTPQEVPANVLACQDYGGCPHFDRCFDAGKQEQHQQQEQEQNMNLTEKLAARKAAQAQPATTVTVESVQKTGNSETFVVVAEATLPPANKRRPGTVAAVNDALSGCVPSSPARPGNTLLIGALPYGSRDEWMHAEDWLRQFADQACETLKVSHWAYAEYGRGKTAIIALVDAAARAGNVPANLILDRRNVLSDAVAEVLLPFYQNVFVKMG